MHRTTLIRSFPGNRREVASVAVSPDGKTIAAGGKDAHLRVWDAQNGQLLLDAVADSEVRAIAYSPDSRRIVSASWDKEVAVWEIDRDAMGEPAKRVSVAHLGSWPMSVAFAPDGKSYYTGQEYGALERSDTETGKVIQQFKKRVGPIAKLAVSQSGEEVFTGSSISGHSAADLMRWWEVKDSDILREYASPAADVIGICIGVPQVDRIFAACNDGTVRSWLPGRPELQETLWGIESSGAVAFSPNRTTLLAGGVDGMIRQYDLRASDRIPSRRLPSPARQIVPFLNGRAAAVAIDQGVLIVDFRTGRTLRFYPQEIGKTLAVAVSQDGRHLLSAGTDCRVTLWDNVTGGHIGVVGSYITEIRGLAVSPDGKVALSIAGDTLKAWDLSTPPREHEIGALKSTATLGWTPSFSADGTIVRAVSSHGVCLQWDLKTHMPGEIPGFERGVGRETYCNSVYLADGEYCLAGADNVALLWEAVSGKLIRTFAGHGSAVNAVAVSADERWVCTASNDHAIRIFDTQTGELVEKTQESREPVTCIAFDGHRLWSYGDQLRMRDLDQPAEFRRLEPIAQRAFRRLAADEHDHEAQNQVGQWYVFRRQAALALDYLNGIDGSGYEASAQTRGECLLDAGRLEDAKGTLEIRLKAHPDDLYVRLCVDGIARQLLGRSP